jgi:hypothetical protein
MRVVVTVMITLALIIPASLAAQQGGSDDLADGPMAAFDALVGDWIARGSGFSTSLSYRWLLPGTMFEAANEVRDTSGNVLARYHGAYAWDRGRGEVVFWTVGEGGEVHRGQAWWEDGILWHEAEISGGGIEVYASAVRSGDQRLEYFAAYGRPDAGSYLLGTEPLVYEPEPGAPR